MKVLLRHLGRHAASEKAQGMVEYAFIAAFVCIIAAIMFATPGRLPDTISGLYEYVQTQAEALAGN